MIISQTPVRISFFGGGTDFYDFYSKHEGCVLSTAVNKYIYVIVNKRFDDKIVINYSKTEQHNFISEIQHEIVREALIKANINKSIEITLISDIPAEGSGMGSSSSLTVGLLNALYKFKGIDSTPDKLANDACEIEIETCRKPIGKQDQYIAAYGGFCEIIFKKDNSVFVNKIMLTENILKKLTLNLVLFYTGITRQSSSILFEQKQNITSKIKELKLIKSFVSEAKSNISNNELDKFGELLNQSWEIKKTLANKISNKHLDLMYDKALKCGALGGKILGAGGGGFLLIYAKDKDMPKIKNALVDYREMLFNFENEGSKIILNTGGFYENK